MYTHVHMYKKKKWAEEKFCGENGYSDYWEKVSFLIRILFSNAGDSIIELGNLDWILLLSSAYIY